MYSHVVSSWDLALSNLVSVGVLAFVFGFIAARVKSDVRVPEQIYQFLSIYLLFGIGLKGGHSLKSVSFEEILTPAVTTIIAGALIPVLAYLSLRFVRALSVMDRGAIAAHYGSTSLVTFSAALLFLESNSIFVEGFAPALLTLMEIPGLIVGIYLGSRTPGSEVKWSETLKEVLLGKTVLLLFGGLFIGAVSSNEGYEKVSPFFVGLLSGLLVLFLLHLGYLAGFNFSEVRKVGKPLIIFGLLFPVIVGVMGVALGSAIGLSVGGSTVLGVLCASASYIAVPAVLRFALPEANPSLYFGLSLGVTFPLNILFGIPCYVSLSKFVLM